MANLVITIISIALVAITAIAAYFYVSNNLPDWTAQTRANMLIDQSRQIYIAYTQYMLDKSLSDFKAFKPDVPIIAGYLAGRPQILNLPTSAATGSGMNLSLDSTRTTHDLCLPGTPYRQPVYMDGYPVFGIRANTTVVGQNAIVYNFYGLPSNTTDCFYHAGGLDFGAAANASHPLVKMCAKLNSTLNTVPSSGVITTASGLPGYASGTYQGTSSATVDFNPSSSALGFCYVANNTWWNASANSGYQQMTFVFVN